MRINPVFTIIKVIETKEFPGYVYRKEIIDGSEFGSKNVEMENGYSDLTGDWIGSAEIAEFLTTKYNLRHIQKAYGASKDSPCSIGFNIKNKKWYGWSHRAIYGFGNGDKLFIEDFSEATDTTPFNEFGTVTIINPYQAKLAASNFAHYVKEK